MQQHIGKRGKLSGRSRVACALALAPVVLLLFVRGCNSPSAPSAATPLATTFAPCKTATATPGVGFLYTYVVGSGEQIVGGGIAAATASGDCQIWHAAVGESSCAPIIAGDVVYACPTPPSSCSMKIVAVRVADGQVLWTTPIACTRVGGEDDPVLNADATTVVVNAAQGGLYALDAHTGSIRWQQALDGNVGNGTPTLHGSVVYQLVQSQDGPYLCSAFRATDGTPLWTNPVELTPWCHVHNATAAFGDTATGQIFALDLRDGHRLWTGQHASAIAATETTVFVVLADFTLAALSAADGTLLWRSSVKPSLHTPLSIVNGLVYVLADVGAPEELAAVRTGDGTILWQVALPDSYDKPPVVWDGVVYLYYTTRDSIGACCYPHIAAYNAMTGEQRWLKSAPDVGGIIQSVASS